MLSRNSELVICKECDGYGYKYDHVMTDYYKREYDTIYHDCKTCNGKGRLRRITNVIHEVLEDRPEITKDNENG